MVSGGGVGGWCSNRLLLKRLREWLEQWEQEQARQAEHGRSELTRLTRRFNAQLAEHHGQ
jgi:hypothetical protein